MKAVVLLATATGALAEPASFPMRSVSVTARDPSVTNSGRQLRFAGLFDFKVANGDKHSGGNTEVGGNVEESTDNSSTDINQSNNSQDHRDMSEDHSNYSKYHHDDSETYTNNSVDESDTDIDESSEKINHGTQINGDKIGDETKIG